MPAETPPPPADNPQVPTTGRLPADTGVPVHPPTETTSSSSVSFGRVPKQIGQFLILRELGRGGMGIVYLARQPSLDRDVALKVLNTGLDTSAEDLARFRAEAQMAAQLQHPNIVQVYEVGEQNGIAYLAMEHVEGGNLHQHLSRGSLTPREAVNLLEPLARAMHYAHQRGIIHRDLKPGNILLHKESTLRASGSSSRKQAIPVAPGSNKNTPAFTEATGAVTTSVLSDSGRLYRTSLIPKITDFGLAKQINKSKSLTATGVALGTPSYMSPEQARDERSQIGPPSDVYSLGAILYEMLTGRAPFEAGTPLATLEKVCREEPVPPCQIRPEIPAELEHICLRCLAKRPQDRYATAEELGDALREFLLASELTAVVAARDTWWKWMKRQPAISLGLLGVVICLIALSFYQLRQMLSAADEQIRAIHERSRHDRETAETEIRMRRRIENQLWVRLALDRCERGQISEGIELLRRSYDQCEILEQTALQPVIRKNLAEWEAQLLQPIRTIQVDSPVMALAYHRDGQLLAGGAKDGSIRFWDARTGQPVGKGLLHTRGFIGGTGREVAWLAWAPVGKRLLSVSKLPYAYLWDTEDYRLIGEPFDLGGQMVPSGFFADEGIIGLSSRDGKLRLRLLPDGKEIHEPLVHDPAGGSVVVARHPSGKEIALAGNNGEMSLWARDKNRWVKQRTVLVGFPVRSIHITADDRLVLLGGSDGSLKVWDRIHKELTSLPGQGSEIVGISDTTDGRCFVTATRHGTIRVWDAYALCTLGQAVFTESLVHSMAIHPDAQTLAVGCEDGTIRWFRLPVRNQLGPRLFIAPAQPSPAVHTVAYSQDGELLLTATTPSSIVWREQGEGWRVPVRFEGQPYSPHAALQPAGRWVALSGNHGRAVLYDLRTAQPLFPPREIMLNHEVRPVFSPTAPRVLFLGPNRTASIHDKLTETGSWLWDFESESPPVRILKSLKTVPLQGVYHPDGRQLWLVGEDGVVRSWDLERDQEVATLTHSARVQTLAISKDGNYLVTGCRDGSIHYWDTTQRIELQTMRIEAEVLAIAIHPDGDLLLTGGSNGEARYWDPTTGFPVGPSLRHADAILSVAFRPDGKTAVTGSRDRSAQIWRVPR